MKEKMSYFIENEGFRDGSCFYWDFLGYWKGGMGIIIVEFVIVGRVD